MRKYFSLWMGWLSLAVSIVCVGCAPLSKSAMPIPTPASSLVMTAAERQQRLMDLQNWTLSGAISLTQNKKTILSHLVWQQRGLAYQQLLSGPMNLGGVRIIGRPGTVQLWRSAQQVVSASDPESLMQRELGWHLPISNLYYWVRGLAVPHIPAIIERDQTNRTVLLKQQGWIIRYPQYRQFVGLDLPTEILLQGQELQAKMVIKHWRIYTART